MTVTLSELPADAHKLCEQLHAPPRLVVHLQLVLWAAKQLIKDLKKAFPNLQIDEAAVRFGAATHDLGKTLFPEELHASGKRHQDEGPKLLVSMGVDPRLARFSRTHSQWDDTMPIEDFLVAAADKIWKGRRIPELEELLVARLAEHTNTPTWQIHSSLDAIMNRIADGSDERIALHRSQPSHT
jgi:hypothetical protein